MLDEFKSYLYKTKNISGCNVNGEIMHLVVGMYNIDYIDEILTYSLDFKDISNFPCYKEWYKDIEVFKEKVNPLIEKFKKENV